MNISSKKFAISLLVTTLIGLFGFPTISESRGYGEICREYVNVYRSDQFVATIQQSIEKANADELDCIIHDRIGYEGGTSLIYAAENRSIEIVELLISLGADINATNDEGYTALMSVLRHDYVSEGTESSITNDGEGNTENEDETNPLIRPSSNERLEIVNLLIANGANVNAVNVNGVTALMRASTYGHLESTEILIANGAEVNRVDDLGRLR